MSKAHPKAHAIWTEGLTRRGDSNAGIRATLEGNPRAGRLLQIRPFKKGIERARHNLPPPRPISNFSRRSLTGAENRPIVRLERGFSHAASTISAPSALAAGCARPGGFCQSVIQLAEERSGIGSGAMTAADFQRIALS